MYAGSLSTIGLVVLIASAEDNPEKVLINEIRLVVLAMFNKNVRIDIEKVTIRKKKKREKIRENVEQIWLLRRKCKLIPTRLGVLVSI